MSNLGIHIYNNYNLRTHNGKFLHHLQLVTCEFKWFGLQTKVESFILQTEKRLFTNFHRQVFCWTDKWHGMTMADIRALEDKTKEELEKKRAEGEVCGTKPLSN